METYPTRTEKAQEAAKFLLKEIIFWFGLPKFLQSDNGLSFVSRITQQVSSALDIQYSIISTVVAGSDPQEKQIRLLKEF